MTHPFDVPDPECLLQAADQIMRARWPTLQPHFYFRGRAMRCQFVYPGELRVHCAATGQLLARSRAGQPTKPARAKGRGRVYPAPIA